MALKSGTCARGVRLDALLGELSISGTIETHLVNVAEVDDGEVLDALGDLEEGFILAHAVLRVVSAGFFVLTYFSASALTRATYRIVVTAEADDDDTLLFYGRESVSGLPKRWL